MAVTVGGESATVADGWAVLTREWKTGDTITVALPFAVRTEGFPDNPRRFAFLNGPIVLAALVDPGKPWPIVLGVRARATAALGAGGRQALDLRGVPDVFLTPGSSDRPGVTLEPLYKIHGDRHYMVYFDAFTPEQWKTREEENRREEARKKELEARTVDRVRPARSRTSATTRSRARGMRRAPSATGTSVTPPTAGSPGS